MSDPRQKGIAIGMAAGIAPAGSAFWPVSAEPVAAVAGPLRWAV